MARTDWVCLLPAPWCARGHLEARFEYLDSDHVFIFIKNQENRKKIKRMTSKKFLKCFLTYLSTASDHPPVREGGPRLTDAEGPQGTGGLGTDCLLHWTLGDTPQHSPCPALVSPLSPHRHGGPEPPPVSPHCPDSQACPLAGTQLPGLSWLQFGVWSVLFRRT